MSGEDTPVLKFTIERDGSDERGDKFTITPVNVVVPSTASPTCAEDDEPIITSNYVKCAVPCCYNYFDGQRQEFIGVSYFPFPDDPELRKVWIDVLKLPPEKDPNLQKVCSVHFSHEDFFQTGDSSNDVSLKPTAKPSRKLDVQVPKSPNPPETGFDRDGIFIGLDNPLMDTSKDVQTAKVSSALLTTNEVMPVITGVVSMVPPPLLQIQTGGLGVVHDVIPTTVLEHSKARSKPARTYAPSTKPMKKVVDYSTVMDMLCVETMNPDEDAANKPSSSKNPEKGLKVIPATVKLPSRLPKVDLVGDSIAEESGGKKMRELGAVTMSRLPALELATGSDEVSDSGRTGDDERPNKELSPSTLVAGDDEDFQVPLKRRRTRRSNKAEMMRREEEDEWEPSFWCKRTLVKDGFGMHLVADQKRKNEKKMRSELSNDGPSNDTLDSTSEDARMQEGLEEEDEGWRILEPIATNNDKNEGEDETEDTNHPLALLEVSMGDGSESQTGPSTVRRRPGPASRTCRPKYIPVPEEREKGPDDENLDKDKTEDDELGGNTAETNKPSSSSTKTEKKYDENDPTLLIDWSFFKSLIPDLGKLDSAKRLELKSFVLDTLNSAIYEGKTISPNIVQT